MKLFNTLSRKVEPFKPFNPEEVKIYTCGPTVYSQPHIGNFAAYVYWDLLVRTLLTNGYGVKRVLNLTDVGHLTSDGDEGEDKLEKGARQSGETVWMVAERYIEAFQKDFRELNLVPPAIWARATDYIEQDKAIVDILTEKGYTYETPDGIYYDTSKFPDYAKFANLDLEHLRAGARVEFSNAKKNPSDFAVWKFIQPGEQHAMRWDYLGRPGYPGWHLECSTIIHEDLGETIDIHCGGIDHIPVHHTNEIAQSETAFEKKLSKYWLHCNFLTIDKQKISKSLGNIWTLEDLASKGYDAMDFKLWVLQGHYQSERDFNFDNLEAARVRRLNWRNRIAESYQRGGEEINFVPILEAASDNLNSPKVCAMIDEVKNANLHFWEQVDLLLGLRLCYDSPNIASLEDLAMRKDPNFREKFPEAEKVQALLTAREDARLKRDFAESDRIRDELLLEGIAVKDTPTGQLWQYAK